MRFDELLEGGELTTVSGVCARQVIGIIGLLGLQSYKDETEEHFLFRATKAIVLAGQDEGSVNYPVSQAIRAYMWVN